MTSEETVPPTKEAAQPPRRRGMRASGLTVRALALGILSAGGSAILYPFLLQRHYIGSMGLGYFPWLAVILLFFFVFVVNVALKLANPRLGAPAPGDRRRLRHGPRRGDR